MKRSRHKQATKELDINEEPTEPSLPVVVLPPSSPPLDWYAQSVNQGIFLAGQSPQANLPNQPIAQIPMSSMSSTPPTWIPPVYPVFPSTSASLTSHQQHVGGTQQSYPVLPPSIPTKNRQRKHSVWPAFVGMFFVAIQLLLLVRFTFRLIDLTASSATPWIAIIYTVSGVCILPFRLLFQHIAFPIPGNLEIYTLIAILFYGLLSRLLARFTKAILRSW